MADLLAIQPPPFGICAFNDETAFATLQPSPTLNIAVPEAVSVIGHDNTLISELSNPALTTIGVEASDLGQRLTASVLSVCQGRTCSGNYHSRSKGDRSSLGLEGLIILISSTN